MIVSERVSGTLYRFYSDKNDPQSLRAEWVLTDDGQIMGLIAIEPTLGMIKEFGAWLEGVTGPLKCETAVDSVETLLKRFDFKAMKREY